MSAMTEAVNRHLKITWESEETAAEVEDIEARAALALGDLLGCEITGSLEGYDRQLYLDLCLYLYNGLTLDEYMDANFKLLTIARQKHVDPVSGDNEDEDE